MNDKNFKAEKVNFYSKPSKKIVGKRSYVTVYAIDQNQLEEFKAFVQGNNKVIHKADTESGKHLVWYSTQNRLYVSDEQYVTLYMTKAGDLRIQELTDSLNRMELEDARMELRFRNMGVNVQHLAMSAMGINPSSVAPAQQTVQPTQEIKAPVPQRVSLDDEEELM